MSDTQPEVERIHPCLVLFNNPEQGLVCMVNNDEFETPGIWGIVLADVVQHIVNAYVKDGMSGQAVRSDIINYLMTELDTPTAKAQRVDAEWHDEGFTIGDEE
jgi:hypothetical protein